MCGEIERSTFQKATGLYAIFGSIVVVLTLALREKLDKKAGALFIALYLLSYTMLRVT
jgi:Ca2+/Na+ antiporter